MKVLVIGATGATGRIAVKKLLAAGHEVTAFARDPSAVEADERVRVVKGDARDPGSLDAAVAGQDAVFCAFGPRSLERTDLQETLMKNLVAQMERHGVKRLVNLSAWGAGDSEPHTKFVFRLIKATFLRHVFADKNRGEAILVSSPLDYVNVRPGRLVNTPARGGVKAALNPRGIKAELTREDLADFMIAQLTSDEWVRKSPIVGY